jgi:hypothetical protein
MVDTVTLSTDEGSTTITTEQFHRAARRVSVPAESQFGDRDFLPADDLEILASDLIDKHTTFSHLPGLRVHYRWKKKGGKKSGAAVYGKCVKPSGLLADYSEADFVIWLAADYVRDADFTQRQIEALLFHEMLHAGISDDEDDDGEAKPVLIAHDFEGFRAEVEHYGWWSSELGDLRKTALQLKLFDDEQEDSEQ